MGTYEARPGAGAGDYTNPSPDHRAGSYQGDGPMGTLTSEMFTIGGDEEEEVNGCSLGFCCLVASIIATAAAAIIVIVDIVVVVLSPKKPVQPPCAVFHGPRDAIIASVLRKESFLHLLSRIIGDDHLSVCNRPLCHLRVAYLPVLHDSGKASKA